MALVFPYQFYSRPSPVWSLHGRAGRPYPVVPMSVAGPAGTQIVPALLDTGADDTVFSVALAALVGVDLTNAPTGAAAGVGLAAAPIWYAEVRLRLSDGREHRVWPARVGFTTAPLKRGLLGFAGFFQFFIAAFDGGREQVSLAANALYPGT